MRHDVVVVGAGLGGLLASVDLAEAGLRVLVVEAARSAGGRASTDDVGGYQLDRGAHALFRGGPLEAALRRHGIEPGVPVPSGDAGLLLGGSVRAPGPWMLPHGKALAHQLACISTYCGTPQALPADLVRRQVWRSVCHGVCYVPGGWGTLSEQLVDRLLAAGGVLQRGVAVRAVDGRRVRTDAGWVPADGVVLAVPPARVEALTGLALQAARPATVATRQLVVSTAAQRACRALVGLDVPVFASDFSAVVRLGPGEGQVWHLVHYQPDAPDVRSVVDGALDAWSPDWRRHVLHDRWLPRMTTWAALGGGVPVAALGQGRWLVGDAYGTGHALGDAVAASAAAAVRGMLGEVREAA